MLRLIKSDMYKLCHRPYLYVMTGCLVGIVVLMNTVLLSSDVTREAVFTQIFRILSLPLFFIAIFADLTMAEESKYGTMKNTVSFGVNRIQLYFSKLVTATLLGVITFSIVFGMFLASGYLFVQPGANFTADFMMNYMARIGATAVLYMGAVSLALMLATLLKKSSALAFVFAGVLIIPAILVMVISQINPGLSGLMNISLLMQCNSLGSLEQSQLLSVAFIGVLYYVVFGILGVVIFKRQEIN